MSKKAKVTLASLKPSVVKMELKHPITTELLGVTIDIVGMESTAFYKAQRELFASRIIDGKLTTDIDVLRKLDEAAQLVATCIAGWQDEEFFGGPYSPEAALSIITNPELGWLKLQVDEFVSVRSNFFTK